jgi:hypothetical protein
MKRTPLAFALAALLMASGCLQKDTISTIYLRDDGSFDWAVVERNVRSDEADPSARAREEADWIESIGRGEHGVAIGFRALGSEDVHVRWLRRSRPFAVAVDGRFDSLSAAFDRLLTRCGIPHDGGMAQDGDTTTWWLRVDTGPGGESLAGNQADGCDDGLDGLADALSMSVVLESGTFTGATGFTIEGSDTAAYDEKAVQGAAEASGRFELSLSWTAR